MGKVEDKLPAVTTTDVMMEKAGETDESKNKSANGTGCNNAEDKGDISCRL